MRKFIIYTGIITLLLVVLIDKGDLKNLSSMLDDLTHKEFYLALANPNLVYFKIIEGERKEQIAKKLEKKLGWNEDELKNFLSDYDFRVNNFEGKYFPGVYLINKTDDAKKIRAEMNERYNKNLSKFSDLLKKSSIDSDKALVIASLIQREAGGKSDMRLISGIIWNRIFKGMTLDIDASLQYIKGNEEIGWWPKVLPEDKKLDSPYNTYKNKSLPPSPISNPGIAAIEAALNPLKTNCLYYLHKNKQIYCSETYKEHQRKIDAYLK